LAERVSVLAGRVRVSVLAASVLAVPVLAVPVLAAPVRRARICSSAARSPGGRSVMAAGGRAMISLASAAAAQPASVSTTSFLRLSSGCGVRSASPRLTSLSTMTVA
jgi:hypothetical protein